MAPHSCSRRCGSASLRHQSGFPQHRLLSLMTVLRGLGCCPPHVWDDLNAFHHFSRSSGAGVSSTCFRVHSSPHPCGMIFATFTICATLQNTGAELNRFCPLPSAIWHDLYRLVHAHTDAHTTLNNTRFVVRRFRRTCRDQSCSKQCKSTFNQNCNRMLLVIDVSSTRHSPSCSRKGNMFL